MSLAIAALLGAWHGLNPAMGWLFATALGLQERRAGAVLRALPPIALGHAASVLVIVTVVAVAERLVPLAWLRWSGAALLLGAATLLAVRRTHVGRIGMRVGARGLFAWSFVMASAHGAGLMLVPLLVGHGGHGGHGQHGAAGAAPGIVVMHTGAMLVAMTCAAMGAFHLSGVGFLRRAWLDTDVLWSGALAASGVVVLVG